MNPEPDAGDQGRMALDLADALDDLLAGEEYAVPTHIDLLDALASAGLDLTPSEGRSNAAYVTALGSPPK